MKYMVYKVCNFVATFFYIGYVPLCPGTVASILTALLCWSLVVCCGPIPDTWFLGAIVIIFCFGTLAAGVVKDHDHDKDPSYVVIDEVVGMMIAGLGSFHDWRYVCIACILFRAFDIFKPPPIHIFERCDTGGLGIMLDDVVAGIWTLSLLCFLR